MVYFLLDSDVGEQFIKMLPIFLLCFYVCQELGSWGDRERLVKEYKLSFHTMNKV